MDSIYEESMARILELENRIRELEERVNAQMEQLEEDLKRSGWK